MKILALLSAGLIAASAMAPATAPAQMRGAMLERNHLGHGHITRLRRVCRIGYRPRHRVRVCRTVRY